MVEVIALNLTGISKLDHLIHLVTPAKQKKLSRIKDPASARQILASDLLARAVICDRLGWKNHQIEYCYNEFGKPALISREDFHFNLSHAGDWVVMALSCSETGIDIEQVVPLDMEIARHFFSASEYQQLKKVPDHSKLDHFFQIWTLKESFTKMTGLGLSEDLNSFSIELCDNFPRLSSGSFSPVFFRQFDIQSNYKLAVCAREDSFSPSITLVNEEYIYQRLAFS
jgi:4'-phosphopantetheinyl transferase